ncbi:MAG TPA: DUF2244 domain-containing protein [Rudaea sp.]|nr:DUF2244 domain-containing protein [Rudaea sp.]
MTSDDPVSAQNGRVSVTVLPHRSLSRRGMVWYLVVQSIAALAFSAAAAWFGIVLAPLFAVLELLILGYCLDRVWRNLGKGQIIALTSSQLEIAATAADSPVACFHPYWVKVRLEPGRWRGWPSRLMVGSHGREVEVGAFLNDTERSDLAYRLTQLLERERRNGRISGNSMQGDSE